MGVLTEYVRKEAEHLKGEAGRREEAIKEWQFAFSRLTDQLKQWVSDADGGLGLLEAVGGESYVRQEAALGSYRLTSLAITLGGGPQRPEGRSRPARPPHRGRHQATGQGTAGADGMVEIRDGSSAEYYLFRLKEEGGDRWYVQSVARWNADPEYGHVEELDRDRFESAILRILK